MPLICQNLDADYRGAKKTWEWCRLGLSKGSRRLADAGEPMTRNQRSVITLSWFVMIIDPGKTNGTSIYPQSHLILPTTNGSANAKSQIPKFVSHGIFSHGVLDLRRAMSSTARTPSLTAEKIRSRCFCRSRMPSS